LFHGARRWIAPEAAEAARRQGLLRRGCSDETNLAEHEAVFLSVRKITETEGV